MNTITPGKWYAKQSHDGSLTIHSSDGLGIAQILFTGHPEHAKKNAELIASLPDIIHLLIDADTALKDLDACYMDNCEEQTCLKVRQRIKRLIAALTNADAS